MEKETYSFSSFLRVIKNNNRVILANTDNGEWIKISLECYSILEKIINSNMDIKKIENIFWDSEDKIYFENMIEIMRKKAILYDTNNIPCNKCNELEIVTFSVTKKCNLCCLHCAYDAATQKDVVEDLPFSKIKVICDELISCNTKKIVITGGEPLLRTDIIEILEYIKKNSNAEIILMTNATLITEDLADKLTKLIDSIDISMDGVNEQTCSLIRGKGVFDKVVNSINILQKRNFVDIRLSMVKTKENIKYIEEFEELCEKLRVKPVLRGFAAEGRGEKNKYILTDFDKDKHVFDREAVVGQQYAFSCKAACNQFFIDYNGDMYPCPILIKEEYKIDNIFKVKSVFELINLKDNKIYSKLESITPYNHHKCKGCNVNIFCWTCYERIELFSRYPEKFEERCNYRLKELSDVIWKE
ncbi:radical SAM protein [Clostridium sp. YIM B02505]|uniref:Radical SAM protein n=1 Tax=Clostridium yunnanense TaxID=2800325 RepID=A0ABS1EJL2_9CLOT|nr:radical SAM protein [Clostridium yunnanense]MBK1809551.1 radical SAM protein [Clostridium yunnanense]